MTKQNIIKKAFVLVCVFGCLNIKTNAQKILTVSAVHEGSRISEFGMVPFKSGWAYVSARPAGSLIKYVNEEDGALLYNIVQIDSADSEERLFQKPFNANCHNGPVAFSNDFSFAIITRNLPSNKRFKDVKQKLGLYFMKEKNGENVYSYDHIYLDKNILLIPSYNIKSEVEFTNLIANLNINYWN